MDNIGARSVLDQLERTPAGQVGTGLLADVVVALRWAVREREEYASQTGSWRRIAERCKEQLAAAQAAKEADDSLPQREGVN